MSIETTIGKAVTYFMQASAVGQGRLWLDSSCSGLHERRQPYILHCFHATKIAPEKDRSTRGLGSFQGCTILPASAGNMFHDAPSILCVLLRKSYFPLVLGSSRLVV